VPSAVPGDIAAVAKVDEIEFDCVLHDSHDEDQIHMRPLEFPTPMSGVAIQPKRRGDEQRISEVLNKMTAEDPTLVVEHDSTLNETVLRGSANCTSARRSSAWRSSTRWRSRTRPPRVPYRETISAPAEGHARHKKQTGGAGQFGEVFLRIDPLPRGTGFEFVDQVKGGVIRTTSSRRPEGRGVRALGGTDGRLRDAGRARHRLRRQAPPRRLEGNRVHLGGRKAFLDALTKARPVVLEPIVNLEVEAPESFMGDVAGDCLRGAARSRHARDGARRARRRGAGPAGELEGYSARLKAMTQGRASWTMSLSHYELAPPQIQQQLATEYQSKRKQVEEE